MRTIRITSYLSWAVILVAWGQAPVDLEQAVREASGHYPSVRAAEEQVAAAVAGIQLARTAYLPHIDVTAGIDRATRNNVFTLLLPSQAIAPISGPVLATSSLTNVWGSTAGVLVSWEPFDLGLRSANKAAAEAGRQHAQATVARTQFEMGTLAADAFLTVVAAHETVKAAHAGVVRTAELRKQVDALVGSGLRAGVDATRTEGEQAAARIQLTRAETALAQARAALEQLLATRVAKPVEVRTGNLLALPPEFNSSGTVLRQNPLAMEQQAVVNEADAKRNAMERSYGPKFLMQGAVYGRGSGARPDGSTLGGLNGLAPDTGNWGIGFTVLFPLFDLPAVRAKEAAQSAVLRSETSRYDQVMTELAGRRNQAVAAVEGARKVAADTPVQVRAAQDALKQSMARYESGLNAFIDVADAQRTLTQAEIDDSLARLNVWRALLALAAVQGDLSPVIAAAVK
jgi:outer membrane protein